MNTFLIDESKRPEVEEILSLLTDDETALQTAKEHFEIDETKSTAFNPELKIKDDSPLKILNESEADKRFLGFFNKRSRRSRERLFKKKRRQNPGSFVIVSEGDSWFQYPVIITDIIDHLNQIDEYAIRSFGFGGDWLSNIAEEAEFMNALNEYKPEVFLLSGGGNDIVGDRLVKFLIPPDSNNSSQNPKDYINEKFDVALNEIKFLYNRLFTKLTLRFGQLNIICHGYDHPIPGTKYGPLPIAWLEKPMKDKGINDPEIQTKIAAELIDRFNEMLIELINQNGYDNRVHHIDCRGTLNSNEWFDELHPRDYGFMKIAQKFKFKIEQIRNNS